MRRPGGRETWHRLLDWDRGHTDSERLVARLLEHEGYREIDPSHPLGGPDGGKDAVCSKNGELWYVAAYFPHGKKSYADIKAKFRHDFGKLDGDRVHGFVFATNQELTLGEREDLITIVSSLAVDLFHLERISILLDSPKAYGLRLEYLAIEMTREEQVAFINDRDEVLRQVRDILTARQHAPNGTNAIESVTTQQFDTLNLFDFDGKLVSCIKCKEVFRARFNPVIVRSAQSIATCPSCGKVQGL